MRATSDVLSKALELLRGGWTSAPLSLDAAGLMCPINDEGITLFCVGDALQLASADDIEAMQNAEDALNKQLRLAGATSLIREWASEWVFDEPNHRMRELRTHGEVLQLFSRAHRIALTKETAR